MASWHRGIELHKKKLLKGEKKEVIHISTFPVLLHLDSSCVTLTARDARTVCFSLFVSYTSANNNNIQPDHSMAWSSVLKATNKSRRAHKCSKSFRYNSVVVFLTMFLYFSIHTIQDFKVVFMRSFVLSEDLFGVCSCKPHEIFPCVFSQNFSYLSHSHMGHNL